MPSLTRTKKAAFYLVGLLIIAGLSLAAAEVILRKKGVELWRKREVPIRVDPGGKFFMKHPTLGYSHIPGSFDDRLVRGRPSRGEHEQTS